MPWLLKSDVERVEDRVENGDPFWPAQLAIGVSIALNLAISKEVTISPHWLIPVVEAVLLVALVILVPSRATKHHVGLRRLALAVTGVVSATSVISLLMLVHDLINGSHASGHQLILSGALIWVTDVLLFAVWFWELDRGGAVERFTNPDALPDFQFPQMENPDFAPPKWRPGFLDYLYTSLTNATAFSPTDTMPLSHAAKAVMALQSVSALATVGLVIARAVNILG
jgi:uncharacterized membrane protein